MSNSSTGEKIASLIKEEYGNYSGRLMRKFIIVHAHLRYEMGDEKFLEYLEEQKVKYPKPTYKISDNLKQQ